MKLRTRRSMVVGEITVPGSKSHTIRAVAAAMMADGESVVRSPLVSGDTTSCLNAAKTFGAKIIEQRVAGQLVYKIKGVAGKLRATNAVVDLGNSGTSLRILAGLAATIPSVTRFDGDSSLRTRPMAPLLSALSKLGVQSQAAEGGKCPLWIKGPIRGGTTIIEGKSSQFVTALLFAAPLAAIDTNIQVVNLNERPYVEITLDWLRFLGIEHEASNDLLHFKIKGHQAYKAFEKIIPADFSTATFPAVAAAVTNGSVSIRHLDFSDKQGDKEIFTYLERMGMEVTRDADATRVRRAGPLRGVELDLNATPDALPAMAVAACFAEGETLLGNVPQARIKETDRIACMTNELRKMGADVTELEDGMRIRGSPLKGTTVESHADHRIAMALAIAGMGAEGDTIVNEAEAAAVTYPDFAADFEKLGADIAEV